MTLKTAKRGSIPPFIVMDVMRAANAREAAGDDVLHLEVGQPGTAAPQPVRAAAQDVLHGDRLGYTDALGVPALRRRIARHYGDTYGVEVDPGRVVVTTGSSAGFVLSFLAVFDPGDRVGVCSPGYPAYRNILRALGIDAVDILVGPDTHYQPMPALLDGLEKPLDGLIVASPGNPTGSMLDPVALEALVGYCTDAGVRLISDEIYHGICYGTRADTALRHGDDAIVINSFSKYYSMTGWRLGWMVLPETLLRPIECLSQNMFISPPTLSQHAGVTAFDCGEVLDGYVRQYAENRATLLAELPKAGLTTFAPPDGAFYLYTDISHLSSDSEGFCRALLAETGIAATPGVDFDPTRGHEFMRFSFAGPHPVMVEAARRLRDWLG